MRRSLPTAALLFLVLALVVPADALARGGRFSGPAGAAPSAGETSAKEEEAHAGGCALPPKPEKAAPVEDAPNQGGVPDIGLGGRGRAVSRAKAPGLADWIYWYEVNREQFEDLRRGAYVTEANPLFALGGARGGRVGRVERRLGDTQRAALRRAVRAVIESEAGGHWRFTEGAAYVALGKIAATDDEIELLTRVLARDSRALQYVQESAALGLGQLRRSEVRRRLPATTLRGVRAVLARVLQDDAYAVRTRAFAGVSLGLLSDQPSVDGRGGARSADTLFRAWHGGDLPDETQVGVLIGLSLHEPEDVPALCRAVLQACVTRGTLKGRSWSSLVRAQAAVTLGRIGSKTDAALLAARLRERDASGPALRQAAVVAAGTLGDRMPDMRAELMDAVLAARRAAKDPAARRLALVAVARMLAAEARRDSAAHDGPAKALRVACAEGAPGDRAFAALALALSVRDVNESVGAKAWQTHRGRGLEILRAGLADRRLDGHARGAFATALGLAKDTSSSKILQAALADRDSDPELRAHAALALGLAGEARTEVVRALVAALVEARSDRLRMRSVTALGLLGGGSAKMRASVIPLLVEHLKKTRNQKVKGQIAITLARIGDARAVAPLIDVLDSMREPHLNRALACAALGLMGDEERTPVLSAARKDSHYLGGSSVVLEILDVL